MSDRARARCIAVILTARPFEYQAVRGHLNDLQEETLPQGTIYEQGSFEGKGATWTVAIAEIAMGNPAAAFECERAINHFDPQVIFFVGIAGGIKDVALSDVVAAEKIYYHESGRSEEEFRPRPDVGECAYELIQRAKAEIRNGRWLSRLMGEWDSAALPNAFVGPIVAGEKVIASTRSATYELIRKSYGDSLAVEMEGRGFLKAVHANRRVPALVIRGISDLLDDKPATDNAGYQELASRAAAAFSFEVLCELYPSDILRYYHSIE